MMFYIDNFAGNMKGVESKIDYLERTMLIIFISCRFWILRKVVLTADMQ